MVEWPQGSHANSHGTPQRRNASNACCESSGIKDISYLPASIRHFRSVPRRRLIKGYGLMADHKNRSRCRSIADSRECRTCFVESPVHTTCATKRETGIKTTVEKRTSCASA